MSEIDGGGTDLERRERVRISRRQLIRNAGIVGAGVWVAPMIIDSLASPAAAASTVVKGCLQVRFNPTSSNNTCLTNPGTFGTATNVTGTPCASPTYMTSADISAAISVSPANCSDKSTIVYTMNAGVDCNFVAAGFAASAGTPSLALAAKTITVTNAGTARTSAVFIWMSCT